MNFRRRIWGKIPAWALVLILAGFVAGIGAVISNVWTGMTRVTGTALTVTPQSQFTDNHTIGQSYGYGVTVKNNRATAVAFHLHIYLAWDQSAQISCGTQAIPADAVIYVVDSKAGVSYPQTCQGPMLYTGPDAQQYTVLSFEQGGQPSFTIDGRAQMTVGVQFTFNVVATYTWFIVAEQS